jgi:hypothetical protein
MDSQANPRRTTLGSLKRPAALLLLAACLLGREAPSAQAQCRTGCRQHPVECRPGCPGCQAFSQGESAMSPSEAPQAMESDDEGTVELPSDDAVASTPLGSDYGTALASAGAVPNMIGDFFGNGYNYQVFNGATVTTAGGDRRFKYADNNSPFPQDRVFFNYHHFHNALVGPTGADRDLDRFTFGLEKTILSDNTSIEVRTPFAAALAADTVVGVGDDREAEFGNVSIALKQILYRNACTAISAGLGIVFPTGDDNTVTNDDVLQITFENESYHLQPFIAMYNAPTERWFNLFFMQWDFDATGSDVILPASSFLTNSSFDEVSTLQDQTLWYIDYTWGYWIHRNRRAQCLTGVATLVELHYSTTLQDQDYGSFVNRGIFVQDDRRDVLNLTTGLYFQLGDLSSLALAVGAPLRDGSDKLYDTELGVQFVRRF